MRTENKVGWHTFIKFYFQLIVFRLLRFFHDPFLLLHQEDDVENAGEHDAGGYREDGDVAAVILDVNSERQSYEEPNRHEAVEEGESPGAGLRGGDVHHEGVAGQIEGGGPTSQILQALQQEVLNLGGRIVREMLGFAGITFRS